MKGLPKVGKGGLRVIGRKDSARAIVLGAVLGVGALGMLGSAGASTVSATPVLPGADTSSAQALLLAPAHPESVGERLAWHESHGSHGSHGSHTSHSSHTSGW
jgi:hypothetical protein